MPLGIPTISNTNASQAPFRSDSFEIGDRDTMGFFDEPRIETPIQVPDVFHRDEDNYQRQAEKDPFAQNEFGVGSSGFLTFIKTTSEPSSISGVFTASAQNISEATINTTGVVARESVKQVAEGAGAIWDLFKQVTETPISAEKAKSQTQEAQKKVVEAQFQRSSYQKQEQDKTTLRVQRQQQLMKLAFRLGVSAEPDEEVSTDSPNPSQVDEKSNHPHALFCKRDRQIRRSKDAERAKRQRHMAEATRGRINLNAAAEGGTGKHGLANMSATGGGAG